jgi:Hydrazine synthase alpha subunit middle domain
MRIRFRLLQLSLMALLAAASLGGTRAQSIVHPTTSVAELSNPMLFVTQMPIAADFATIGAVFANHKADMQSVGRGGDLWIRYPDGALKNLTETAGYGSSGLQGANAIAVRDPAVSWDGTKAIFSMVVGAPTQRYQVKTFFWQLYEASGLAQNQTPVITKVPNQPATYNNISPIYGTDDRIIFVSDRPRDGESHLYPQLDEYELTPVNTGLWSLNPTSGDLFLLDHAPSGDFTPSLDSFGRVIFTRWDHLQRDQEADADAGDVAQGQPPTYGTFNYANESAGATYQFNARTEVFPEPRSSRTDLLAGTNLVGHTFNFFAPWQINEDGTEAETLNHIGRQEFGIYSDPSFNDDPNLTYLPGGTHANQYQLRGDGGLLHIKESPATPGLYYATNAREFGSHAAGQIISITGAPTLNADQMVVTPITHPATAAPAATLPAPAGHSGLYRDPLPLTDGSVVAVHTAETRPDANTGTTSNPGSRYDFRLKLLTAAGNGYQLAGQPLTGGIVKSLSYWDPDTLVSYNGPMWELNPVEVRARTKPARLSTPLPAPELAAFAAAGVDPATFKAYLAQHNLALAVTRNVTSRDNADRQQPFNLRVIGGVQKTGAAGKIYDVAFMQFFQADLIRGKGLGSSSETPAAGRRVLAQPMHDSTAQMLNSAHAGTPASSVTIAGDGSMAAFVPARRAMSWQMTDSAGTPVVRERLWVTFQPGEVRVCASCHGLNNTDQAGAAAPANTPDALYQLLLSWKSQLNIKPSVFLPLTQR